MRVRSLLFFSLLMVFGCSIESEPIIFGSEQCHQCLMGIQDFRYGGVILTEKGKSYKFDSLNCLLKFQAEKLGKTEVIKEIYALNSFKKGELIKINQGAFLKINNMRSPMGLGIWASSTREEMSSSQSKYGGEIMSWPEVKELLK